jgi:hypothetical protein
LSLQAKSQDISRELLFSGFAFAGNNDSKASRFQYTSSINDDFLKEGSSLSREIVKRIGEVKNTSLKVVSGKTFQVSNSNDTLNTVLVLTGETILVENYGQYWKIFVNLRGDALIFDYKEKSIVKTYPLNLAIFDAVAGQTKPSNSQIKNLIKDNILSNKKEGFLTQYIDKLSLVSLSSKNDIKTFQIKNVTIKSDAENAFPEDLKNLPDVEKDIIADSFASEMSSKTNITLIPPKYNGAIASMTVQLEDISQQIELKIGDADYLINITINKLAKAKQQQTNTEISNIYGVNSSIQVLEPLSQDIYFDSILKNGAVSISPINKISSDDFPAYYDVINGLFKKFATSIKTKDLSWIKVASGNDKISNQIEKLSNLIEKGKID